MANIYGSNHSTDVPQSESSNTTSLPGDVLTEIKNLLAALSVFVLAMTIVTLAALQLKFCIYRMKRNRRQKPTQEYRNTSEPLKNMSISAISESVVKSPKKINFLAKLDEFEILTPLTPNTTQTNFVALLPPTVPYNRSPGRITLFPLSCSLRRVNLNRIYCSPDRPDIVFSLYDSMKAFNGTTGGNDELDLISVDRTSYASVVDKNNPTDNKRGISELTEQCEKKKSQQHCVDSDAYPSSVSSITTDDDIPSLSKSSGREDSANMSYSATEYTSDKSLHNRLYQINKNNKTINNNNNNNNNNNINDSASSPSGSSMRDSISGADTTDSLSDNVFDEHEDLTKFNDTNSQVRVSSSGVNSFYGIRTKNIYSENNGNISSTYDTFSLRLTNLDKIVEETESETDNSRPTYRIEEQIIPISLSHYEK
ncbi:hypothetical protein T06_13576 [Trichinella sp. T6]|nr:hypothetical protein T06_13576 [Trichinella sp. T6]